MGWQPIETAPKAHVMIVVIAIRVDAGGVRYYNSDPYCVWWGVASGSWMRWPHQFQPTHWCPLPDVDARDE